MLGVVIGTVISTVGLFLFASVGFDLIENYRENKSKRFYFVSNIEYLTEKIHSYSGKDAIVTLCQKDYKGKVISTKLIYVEFFYKNENQVHNAFEVETGEQIALSSRPALQDCVYAYIMKSKIQDKISKHYENVISSYEQDLNHQFTELENKKKNIQEVKCRISSMQSEQEEINNGTMFKVRKNVA